MAADSSSGFPTRLWDTPPDHFFSRKILQSCPHLLARACCESCGLKTLSETLSETLSKTGEKLPIRDKVSEKVSDKVSDKEGQKGLLQQALARDFPAR